LPNLGPKAYTRPEVERFGDYELQSLVGVGPTGEVWMGQDADGKRVRIKRSHANLKSSRDAVRSIERLTKAWTQFGRARIPGLEVAVSTVLPDEQGRFCVVTEPREWTPLAPLPRHLDRVRQVELACAIGIGLGSVLDAVHAHDFVHGRLTPSNVLVAGEAVEVVDFFWSHAGWSSWDHHPLPPELTHGGQATDLTDQWWWGGCLEHLFEGLAPDELGDWLARVRAPDPYDRFPDTGQALTALRSIRSPRSAEVATTGAVDVPSGPTDPHEATTVDIGPAPPTRVAPAAPPRDPGPPPAPRPAEHATRTLSAAERWAPFIWAAAIGLTVAALLAWWAIPGEGAPDPASSLPVIR
jgi:hypothetical protein